VACRRPWLWGFVPARRCDSREQMRRDLEKTKQRLKREGQAHIDSVISR
jgi:hypothetical protein